MSSSSIVFGGAITGFFALGGYTFYYISTKLGNNDSHEDAKKAFWTITVMNSIIVLLFLIVSYMYTSNNPLVRPIYTLVMTHMALLFSITGLSISMIQKLS
jgi:hypothetical protein